MVPENDLAFLTKRRRLVALWPAVATVLAVGLGGFVLWGWFQAPHVANPRFVAEALMNGTVDQSWLETATLLLPIFFWSVIVTLAILIGLGFATVAKEKRYLAIIARLRNQEQDVS